MNEICAILKEYLESDTEGIIDLFKEYKISKKDKTEVHAKLKELDCSRLMAFDANGLYASAMTEAKDKITFTNRRDRNISLHLWNEETFRLNYVKKYNKLNDTQYIVEINDEEKEFIPPKDSTRLTHTHLFTSLMDFISYKIYYTDTDLASTVKYNIILTSDGVLKEKFKGYSNYKISVEIYLQLANGQDVKNKFNKRWKKCLTEGIIIPDEKPTKVFRSYLNLVKRKEPDDEGIMWPYNHKDEMCLDDDYEFGDFDYFTNVSNDDDPLE
ncbi:hypothetical protein LOTGIDRAFT_158800 [Lottia gigantea]|uniref:DNA-directed DNA polymerase n=1 Tax=Lottia gigantea TaxID=225164 RepID=V4AYT3_LOTGI|nr:hypothetical protein LOTGIDRAFT_158800 [Lottia gigantea]ESO98851.1 hypothetical protein LOTGIDRAFT_158800 [Lottia gigantea]